MRIVTDSGADLTQADIDAHSVSMVPLYIVFPDGAVPSSDMTPDEFYDRLAAMAPDIPSTAQPSPGELAQMYDALCAGGESVLSVHISSGLSGTVGAARLGAEHSQTEKVVVVDAMTLAGGERFQVLAAALAAEAGWALPKIVGKLAEIRAQSEVVFTLETLEYLAKGGRIGRVSALAGALLRIKPVIHVAEDGRYTNLAKARTLRRAEEKIVEHLFAKYGDEPLWLSVQHGRMLEEAKSTLAMLRERLVLAKEEIIRISPVLGVHTGPGIVGVSAVPMRCFEGLL